MSHRLIARRRIAFAALGLLWAAQRVVAGGPPAAPASDEVVWHWFDPCPPNPRMLVTVLVKGRSLYATSFPACARRRTAPPTEPTPKTLVFRFQENAALFGEEFRSLGTQTIERNIWRAGGESHAILLGVSFVAGDRILLNTIHIAEATRISDTAMAKGLVIRTSAVRTSRDASAADRP